MGRNRSHHAFQFTQMIFPFYFHPIPHLHRGEVAPTPGDDFVHDLGSPLTNGGHKELAKTVIQLIYDLKYIVAMNYTDFLYIYILYITYIYIVIVTILIYEPKYGWPSRI